MLRIVLLFLLFVSPFCVTISANEDKPVVIALAPFCDFSRCPNTLHTIMALRDKVTANLLQNYNCVILSRSNGMVLSLEKSLDSVNKLEQNDIYDSLLPSADYSIVGYFKIARRTPGKKWSVDLGCTLLVTNLHNDDESGFQKINFIPDEATLFAEDLTKEIVKALNLKRKKRKVELQKEKIDETWAILPLKRLESRKAMRKNLDKDLALGIELSLQQSGKIKQIVDHTEIDKIFEELKIKTMNAATESLVANIARLVGADKVIMGSVSKVHLKKSQLRLDLFLVDSKKAIILDSATAMCLKNNLFETASKLALNFINSEYKLPNLNSASSDSLNRESKIYIELLLNMGKSNLDPISLIEFSIPFIETIYLLAEKNQEEIYKVGRFIVDTILKDDLSLKDKVRLSKLAEKLLKSVEFSKSREQVFLLRASALKYIPEQIDDAISLAKKHIAEHPNVSTGYANFIIAQSYYKKKDYEKAFEFAKLTRRNSAGIRLLAKLYQMRNNPEDEAEELKVLNGITLRKELKGHLLVRKLHLLHKLQGARATLQYSRRINSWARVRPEIQLEIVKAHIALNNKLYAATILANLDSGKSIKQSGYKDKKEIQHLKKSIKRLRDQLNIKISTPKKLSEFYKIPEKYKVYIIPIGNPDMKLINNSVPAIKNFLGCNVQVLPKVPIPDDPCCFKKSRGQYDATRVLQRLKKSIKIPEDAITVVVVTGKDIFIGNYRYVYSASYNGLRMISYQKWYGAGNQRVLTDMLAKTIAGAYMVVAGMNGCPINSCLNSSSGSAWGAREKSFSVCAICQKKLAYKTADYVYRRFQQQYNHNYPLVKHDKQKWMDDYKKRVTKILNESNKSKVKK